MERGEIDAGGLENDDDADENDEISDDGGERHPCARIQAALGKDFFGKPFLGSPGEDEKKNKENKYIEERPDSHPVPTGGEKGEVEKLSNRIDPRHNNIHSPPRCQ
jgi:hypothetical protein